MFRVTQSLVERHAVDIQPLEDTPEWGGMTARDPASGEQHFYAKYGLGLSLAAVPGYLAGRVLAPLARDSEKDLLDLPESRRISWYDSSRANFTEAFEAFAVNWTNCFVLAGAITGIFLILLELGFTVRVSLATAALAAVATPAWAYSKAFFAEPLGSLGLVFFLYCARRGSRGDGVGCGFDDAVPGRGSQAFLPRRGWWLFSGLSLGVAVLAKPAFIVLILPGLALLLGYQRGVPRRGSAIRLASFTSGIASMVGVMLFYNWWRFGMWWESGYGDEAFSWTTPWREGLTGLLLSPGRGLLFYFPLWVLAVAGLRRFAARALHETGFVAGCLLVLLGLHVRWHEWEGGWCWGPRYLFPVVPLLVLPVAALLQELPRSRTARGLIIAVVLVALVVSFSGVWVSFADYHDWLHHSFEQHATAFHQQGFATSTQVYRWSWSHAPLVGYWRFPVKRYFLVTRALRRPGLILALYALWAALFAASAALLLRGTRAIRWHIDRFHPSPGRLAL